MVLLTHAHTHTHKLQVWGGGGRGGGGRQDKQSSKKHSSDPLSWWVACLDAAETAAPEILHSLWVCPRRPVLQPLTHFSNNSSRLNARWCFTTICTRICWMVVYRFLICIYNLPRWDSDFFVFNQSSYFDLSRESFPSKTLLNWARLTELESTIRSVCV